IETLQKQAEAARGKELKSAVAEVRRIVKEFSLSAADCGFSGGKASSGGKTGKPVAVKFRHPGDSSLTWSGRGKPPKWLSALEAEGRRREEFRV
ncbi:MAG: H-NS histone family protein, partial [Propionivibrio sp.]